ncbi:MAG TPA: hypothetical protein VMH35_27240 [Streptosporangiaceae bacterium]|nr:hypothetical protein [Streptosporangiaceae bacterium]
MDFPDGGAVLDLDVAWIHGSEAPKYNTDPDIQVHAADQHTDETPLELTTQHLEEVQRTLAGHDRQRDRCVLPQMIITPAG